MEVEIRGGEKFNIKLKIIEHSLHNQSSITKLGEFK